MTDLTYTMLSGSNFRKAVHTRGPIKLCYMCSKITDKKPWKSYYVELLEHPQLGKSKNYF